MQLSLNYGCVIFSTVCGMFHALQCFAETFLSFLVHMTNTGTVHSAVFLSIAETFLAPNLTDRSDCNHTKRRRKRVLFCTRYGRPPFIVPRALANSKQ
jgi:hypothetical protein